MIEAAFFGSLGRDAELKTSKADKEYLRLNVRVGDGDGAQWVSATVFDAEALTLAPKLIKGARVYIEGRLSLDEWTGQDGAKRHGLSVMSWHCRLAAIGRNRSKRDDRVSVAGGTVGTNYRSDRPDTTAGDDFHNDPIPF
jgi:single-stranded DNA-binding protein